MGNNSNLAIIRSVDSLQKIYAVIIALAIGKAIQTLFSSESLNIFEFNDDLIKFLPCFFSFIVLLVPFYHGMNRHLDKCYLEKTENIIHGALLFDFIIFFFESSLLYAFAASLLGGYQNFLLIAILLTTDTIWAIISYLIHYRGIKPNILFWALINFLAIVLGIIFALIGSQTYSDEAKTWIFLIISITRTIADYWVCWRFYFPNTSSADKATS